MDSATEQKLKDLISTNDPERVIQAVELAETLGANAKWFQENLTGFLYFYLQNASGDMSEIEDVLSLVKRYNIKRFQSIDVYLNGDLYYTVYRHFGKKSQKARNHLGTKCLAVVREYCDEVGIDRGIGDLLFNIGGKGECTVYEWNEHLKHNGSLDQAKQFILERVQ